MTDRSTQVLQLIANGYHQKEIARILFLSLETVKWHLKAIRRKLSALTTSHAVAIALREGIIQ